MNKDHQYSMELRVKFKGELRIMPFTAKAVSEEAATVKAKVAAKEFYDVPFADIEVIHKGVFY